MTYGRSQAAREIEVIGDAGGADVGRFAGAVLDRVGVGECHVAVEFVGEDAIKSLNREFRERDRPTDVLSFPVDGGHIATGGKSPPPGAPLELGDVIVCVAQTEDVEVAVVHGMLHLCGYDHERDGGEMLALQDEIVGALRR